MVLMRWISALFAVVLISGAAGSGWAAGPQPADPQPNGTALEDGLAVEYYFAKYNHIRELETWMKYKKGKPGDPIAMLDSKVGAGTVLTSGVDDLVGAHITGFIGFDAPGTYRFQVTSNDGIRISLGGAEIYQDPNVHADRTSDPISVEIAEAGWYPLEVLYFEKKNTSTIQLYWSPPGGSSFDAVPASALKH